MTTELHESPQGIARSVSIIVLLIVASRLVVFSLGIVPNEANFTGNWQTLDIANLADRLLFEIWNLHSQPPLWNLIVGFNAKLCSADVSCVIRHMYMFNLVLTCFAVWLLLQILFRLGVGRWIAFSITLVFALSPSTVFYELYIFYAHATMVMMLGVVFGLLEFSRTRSLFALAITFFFGFCLCWLWSLFHPIFIFVIFGCALMIDRKSAVARASVFITVLAFAVAISPSIKNQVKFEIFSNGSWLGFNFSQVVRGFDPSFTPECRLFEFALEQRRTEGVSHPGTALNSPEIVPLSKQCLHATLIEIQSRPAEVIWHRIAAVAYRHQMFPQDYFIQPTNWDKIPDLPFGYIGTWEERPTDLPTVFFGWTVFVLYALAYGIIFLFAVKEPNKKNRSIFISLMCISIFFSLLSFGLNYGEQQRMRYTIEPFFLIALAFGLSKIRWRTKN